MAADFGELLFALSLVPAGSIRALNILAHSLAQTGLLFRRRFEFTSDPEEISARTDPVAGIDKLDVQAMLEIAGGNPVQTSRGPVKIADVRKSVPAQGLITPVPLSRRPGITVAESRALPYGGHDTWN